MSDSVTIQRVDGDPSSVQSFVSSWLTNVSRTSLDHIDIENEGHAYYNVTLIWTS